MKKYKIKVNGKLYEVELEAVTETTEKITAPVKEETKEEVKGTSTTGNNILAPIAGKIVDVLVNVGDKVTKGKTVAIVEAMKLENEVVSPFDGVVKEIKITKGAMVQNQDVIIILG